MAYERVPTICYPAMGQPNLCAKCPTAAAIVAAGRTALDKLRPRFDERQPHVSDRDKSLWITEASDARLRAENPDYAAAIEEYETARTQRNDINVTECPGGIIDRPPDGPATYTCQFQPSPDTPPLPVPPGTTQLPPGH